MFVDVQKKSRTKQIKVFLKSTGARWGNPHKLDASHSKDCTEHEKRQQKYAAS